MNPAIMAAVASKGNPPPNVSVAPASTLTRSNGDFENISNFTGSFAGASPSSIVWGVESVSNATASVFSGQGTATATIQLVTNDSGAPLAVGSCVVRCTAVIGGVSYSATAYKEHDFSYGGGGHGV